MNLSLHCGLPTAMTAQHDGNRRHNQTLDVRTGNGLMTSGGRSRRGNSCPATPYRVLQPAYKAVSPKSLVESSPKTSATVALGRRMAPPHHAFIVQPDRPASICWNIGRCRRLTSHNESNRKPAARRCTFLGMAGDQAMSAEVASARALGAFARI